MPISLTRPRPFRSSTEPRPASGSQGAIAWLGAWSARHRRLVLVGWIGLLVAATLGHGAVDSSYSDTLSVPGSAAQKGLNILKARDPRAGGSDGQLVFSVTSGSLRPDDPAIEQARAAVSKLPHVLSVGNPLSSGSLSGNGQVAYAAVNFDTNPQSLHKKYIAQVDHAVSPATRAGVQVSYGGSLGQAATPRSRDSGSELIGVIVALLVLLVGFGSVYAALLPLFSAIVGVVAGIGVLGIVAGAVAFGTASPTLGTMMGLGVGIDYALFLTTRHRQLLIEGEDPEIAIGRTMAASGRSVALAGCTVVVAMLGLYASGIAFIGKLGLAAGITVAIAALAALTLVPALLAFARGSIDRIHVRRPLAEPVEEGSPLHRYARVVARHPWRFAVSGIALLLVIAIPTVSMQFGHVGPGSEPRSDSERQAYDAVSRGFGPGATGPLTIVVTLGGAIGPAEATQIAGPLRRDIASVPDVKSVSSPSPSADGDLLVARVIPDSGPYTTTTKRLVDRLQGTILPHALASRHATGYVTGTAAATIDFAAAVSDHLVNIIAVVIAAAFLLLLCAFRSPVVALVAAGLNVLSIGAAYGILVAAFQWGWATTLFGIPGRVPIEAYVPMIIFAIVFGLSMDYEVFLISRIREHWLGGHDTTDSVARGLAQTARVISCAALILACVFFSFLLSTNVDIKMLALGLGMSVLIDATIIRLMIVPSLMFLFGKANWWMPGWLDRVLPHLEPRAGAGARTDPTGACAIVGSRADARPGAG